jgi:hypothetical protein
MRSSPTQFGALGDPLDTSRVGDSFLGCDSHVMSFPSDTRHDSFYVNSHGLIITPLGKRGCTAQSRASHSEDEAPMGN